MSAPQGIAILGATGSVGKSTLDLIKRHPDRFRAVALTAFRSSDALLSLCLQHKPRVAVLAGHAEDAGIRRAFRQAGCTSELLFGAEALEGVAQARDADMVMAAIVGAAGLASTLAAARAGKRVLLANKEALVMAGALFMRAVADSGATLLPIDSEHNAVFQCMPQEGANGARRATDSIRRILLTASGGPFRTTALDRLATVTPDEACAHPKWVMGRKISVDSATMMNKGLEVIEARWLFDIDPAKIEVVVHPQSIVHSLIEYRDGSVIAQLSNPDMRVPIAHALAFPERIESGVSALDLGALGQLTFEPPDLARFPCLSLARRALAAGGTAPALLNAANEVAVDAFLDGRLPFTAIPGVIAAVLDAVAVGPADSLERLLDADAKARARARADIAAVLERAA
ncbi:MAG: 1-deoxy-D-xylulose-5-phosphate reductoisomerase [Proteobacteria bacterium]|nr:1-deoxy-D-xylulose-5-phosphate reductoisomerase [Pseudomonadota bacterium]